MTHKQVFFSAFDGRHSIGAGALLNSLFANAFKGVVVFFLREGKPAWSTDELHLKLEQAGITLEYKTVDTKRHMGYGKPLFADELFDSYPEAETVAYADPDIVVLHDWSFFERWAQAGVGLVIDCNFGFMPNTYPWRNYWRNWAKGVDINCNVAHEYYANSGFFILSRKDRSLLQTWKMVIEKREADEPGSTESFQSGKRGLVPTAGDQDALAIAMMADSTTVSWMGQEAMGFTGHNFLLSHAVDKPKPWDKKPLKDAIKSRQRISEAYRYWLKYTASPAEVLPAKQRKQLMLSTKLAKVVNTFMSK